MSDFLRRVTRRVFCALATTATLGFIAHSALAADAIDCGKSDLVVTISDVKHDRDAGRSTVAVYFSVTCKGAAVTAGYQARTKITTYTEERSQAVAPDGSGKAVIRRVEQMDPGGEDITVIVKGNDGDAASDVKKIPKA